MWMAQWQHHLSSTEAHITVSGLQPPTLQHAWDFNVHRGDFVQILHVHHSHWSVVSNTECENGIVKYYDSMYRSISSQTMQLVASLVFSSVSVLEVRIMDAGQQTNGSDCGVLAIAFAFDICCKKDPCSVRFDHKSIRRHLATCLVYPFSYTLWAKFLWYEVCSDDWTSLLLTEKVGVDQMAECEACKVWYHQHCMDMDIPNEVFNNPDVTWKCKKCELLWNLVSS